MTDVTDATFETAVLERSKMVPVVVDLWAPWCGPCKTLTPILEKVIGETQGLVELAKVNVDENPEISGAFQVQSIPAVYAMQDGKVVDGFMGATSEAQVVEFVQKLIDNSAAVVEDAASSDDVPAEVASESSTGGPGTAPVAPAEEATPAGLSEQETEVIEAELEQLLLTVKGDDEARERYIALLDRLGNDNPRTNGFRRRLASVSYCPSLDLLHVWVDFADHYSHQVLLCYRDYWGRYNQSLGMLNSF